MFDKVQEIVQEFRGVVLENGRFLDAILPPLLFLLLITAFDFQAAAWGALGVAVGFAIWRLVRRRSLIASVAGIVGVLVAMLFARLLNRDEGFFVPSILIGATTVIIALISIVAGSPMVAWSSYLARRWPWQWYLHPKVKPAYVEVTWFWLFFFLLRVLLQVNLFQTVEINQLAGLNLLLGWPATVLLLIISYVYGTWRLRHLGGPSVVEFEQDVDPPWESQRRGF